MVNIIKRLSNSVTFPAYQALVVDVQHPLIISGKRYVHDNGVGRNLGLLTVRFVFGRFRIIFLNKNRTIFKEE